MHPDKILQYCIIIVTHWLFFNMCSQALQASLNPSEGGTSPCRLCALIRSPSKLLCSEMRMRGTDSILQEGIFVIISEANLLHVVPCSFRLPIGKRIVCLEQPFITAKTVSTQGTSFLYPPLCHVMFSRSWLLPSHSWPCTNQKVAVIVIALPCLVPCPSLNTTSHQVLPGLLVNSPHSAISPSLPSLPDSRPNYYLLWIHHKNIPQISFQHIISKSFSIMSSKILKTHSGPGYT